MARRKNKWQRRFIKEVFDTNIGKEKIYSKIILENLQLIDEKNNYLPKYLLKYYAPTSENILDLRNQQLWLSHPKYFNDPFDCNIGYDKEKYERRCLLKYIENSSCVEDGNKNGFTVEERNRIRNSYLGEINYRVPNQERYYDVKNKLLESKSPSFRQNIEVFLYSQNNQIDLKIEKLKEINIRVACFSRFDKIGEFSKQILMWSHYADNHKGFCVEYNLDFLKSDIKFTKNDYEYSDRKDEYLDERNRAIIKAGLFPVEYTSDRINIPVTKLNKITSDNIGNIKHNGNIDEIIYKTFIVKSSNWSYEKEWRILIDQHISEYFDNKIPFPYAKTIYLGCKADDALIDTMIKIGDEINAEIILLKMDLKKFELVRIRPDIFKFNKEKKQWKNPYKFK